MFIDPGKRNAMLDTGSHPSTLPITRYHRPHITKRHGFTLLEITLAVAILGMMSLAIFRFVQTNLTAGRDSLHATRRATSQSHCGYNLKTARVIGSISVFCENRSGIPTLQTSMRAGCP